MIRLINDLKMPVVDIFGKKFAGLWQMVYFRDH